MMFLVISLCELINRYYFVNSLNFNPTIKKHLSFALYSRDNHNSKLIEQKYQLFGGNHKLFISVASLGEIDAIIKRLQLGEKRQRYIQCILSPVNKIGINFTEIISRYLSLIHI